MTITAYLTSRDDVVDLTIEGIASGTFYKHRDPILGEYWVCSGTIKRLPVMICMEADTFTEALSHAVYFLTQHGLEVDRIDADTNTLKLFVLPRRLLHYDNRRPLLRHETLRTTHSHRSYQGQRLSPEARGLLRKSS